MTEQSDAATRRTSPHCRDRQVYTFWLVSYLLLRDEHRGYMPSNESLPVGTNWISITVNVIPSVTVSEIVVSMS